MQQVFWALLFGLCFAFLGKMAVDGHIPPLDLLGEPAGPIACGLVGVAAGFWLGRR